MTSVPLITQDKQRVTEAIDITDRVQQQLPVTTGGEATGALTEGVYAVWCTADLYIKVGFGTVDDVTADTGMVVYANNVESVIVPAGAKIGAVAGTSVTMRYMQIG